MLTTLIIIHVIIALILVVAVLMQHGKQQGLSGAIAGGAETFFGKNKGRTIDAVLKKATSVIAALFVISSVTLALVTVNEGKAKTEAAQEATEGTEAPAGETQQVTVDEDGNLVDSEGNVIMTAEQMAEQQAQAEAEAPAEGETTEAEAPAEGEAKAE